MSLEESTTPTLHVLVKAAGMYLLTSDTCVCTSKKAYNDLYFRASTYSNYSTVSGILQGKKAIKYGGLLSKGYYSFLYSKWSFLVMVIVSKKCMRSVFVQFGYQSVRHCDRVREREHKILCWATEVG